jgi:hypothetical protein
MIPSTHASTEHALHTPALARLHPAMRAEPSRSLRSFPLLCGTVIVGVLKQLMTSSGF